MWFLALARRSVMVCALACLAGVPGLAQMDISGQWGPVFDEDRDERAGGPELGEYFGMPINDASRARAELWDSSIQSLPEWQCRPHGVDYITRGPSDPFITPEIDPVTRNITAYHMEWLRSVDRPVYMDGRPHPGPNEPHTWSGFSTGQWIGDVLRIHTTHIKEDYIRRNGLPRSDRAEVVEYLIRNEDVITWTTITYDPVYLEEPLIRTGEFLWEPHQQVPPYPCTVVTEVDRAPGFVPHYFPGENPYALEAAGVYNLPLEATRGGAVTMYPEFKQRLEELLSGDED
jgi:hypothetical protein